MSHPAIPTTFEGVNFRSRLEARWAAMFDLLGWRWTYEPIDLAGYIPDFVVHLAEPTLVEVKPAMSVVELKEMLHGGKIHGDGRPMLLLGASPLEFNHDAMFGLYCESGSWDFAIAHHCESRHVGFFPPWGEWHCRVCGHYCGSPETMDVDQLDGRWREAGNRVQWRRVR